MPRTVLVAGLMLVAIGCEDKKAAVANRDAASGVRQAEAGTKHVAAAAPAAGGQKEPPAPPEAQTERKIIYTARIDLHVANLDEARGKLDALLVDVKGYVAKSDESGRSGGSRSGTWRVRVPVAAFHDFLARVETFGELINKTSDAQDVTEEYVDLEARLKNLKAEEAVLNRLLTEKAQSTADLLAFRRQITDVREQIERIQARLTMLSRLTAMTTIDIVMSEDKTYIPPTAPTFGTSIGRTFSDSIDTLERLGKGLVLMLVAIAPWSPLIIVGVWLGRRGLRAALSGTRSV
jgi:hypothetical protein